MKEQEPTTKLTMNPGRLYAGRERIFMPEGNGGVKMDEIRELAPQKETPMKMGETIRTLFSSNVLKEQAPDITLSLFELTNPKRLAEWEEDDYARTLVSLRVKGEGEKDAMVIRDDLLDLADRNDQDVRKVRSVSATFDVSSEGKEQEVFAPFERQIKTGLSEMNDEQIKEKYLTWSAFQVQIDTAEHPEEESAVAKVFSFVKDTAKEKDLDTFTEYVDGFKGSLKKLQETNDEQLKEQYKGFVSWLAKTEKGKVGAEAEAIGTAASKLLTPLTDELTKRHISITELHAEVRRKLQKEAVQRGERLERPLSVGAAGRGTLVREPENVQRAQEVEALEEMLRREEVPDIDKSGKSILRPANIDELDRALARVKYHMGETYEPLKYDPISITNEDVKRRDERLLEGDIRNNIEERMRRITGMDFKRNDKGEVISKELVPVTGLDILNDTDETRTQYFVELQRWVNSVLKNDVRTPGGTGTLTLPDDKFDEFKVIANFNPEDIIDAKKRMVEIKKHANKLRDFELQNYFQGMSHGQRIKVREGEYYNTPQSIEDVMTLIGYEYGSEYATGGKYELIDKNGDFKVENFYYWARHRVNYIAGENPAGQINPLSEITVRAGYSELPLQALLYIPQYRQHKELVIAGNEAKGEKTETRLGPAQELEKFNRQRAEDLLYEIVWYGRAHNERVAYKSASRAGAENFLKVMEQINGDDYLARNGNIFRILRRPGHSEEEIDNFYNKGEQGRIGRAISDTILAYNYLTEFTEFKTKDSEREENMFYKLLEGNGSNAFFLGLAEASLQTNSEAKALYIEFTRKRIEDAYDKYKTGLNSDQIRELYRIKENFLCKDEKKEGILYKPETKLTISFDSNDILADFYRRVDGVILEESTSRKNYEPELADRVKTSLLRNLKKEFLEPAMAIELDICKPGEENTGTKQPIGDFIDIDGMSLRDWIDAEFGDDREREDYEKFIDNNPAASIDSKKYFERNEKFALKLAEQFIKVKRQNLNYFKEERNHPIAELAMDYAIRKSIGKTYNLQVEEATYAHSWARNYLWPTGIAAQNDTGNISFDYWTRLLRTEGWRKRQGYEDKGIAGLEETYGEIKAMSMNWWHLLRLREENEGPPQHSLFETLQGGEGVKMKSRKDRKIREGDWTITSINVNAQNNIWKNNLTNASKFLEILVDGDMQWDKLIKVDENYNTVIDYKKAGELYKAWWSSIRYTLGKHNDLDYSKMVRVDGKTTTLLKHELGPKTLKILEEIAVQGGDRVRNELEKKDPSLAIFASVLGAEITVHHKFGSHHERWKIEDIERIEKLFSLIHRDILKDKNGEKIKDKNGENIVVPVFNRQLWQKMITENGGRGYRQWWLIESTIQSGGGFSLGAFAALMEFLRQIAPRE